MDPTGVPNRRNPVVSSAGEVILLELVVEYWSMVRVRLSAIDCSSVGIMLFPIARGENSCFHLVDEASL